MIPECIGGRVNFLSEEMTEVLTLFDIHLSETLFSLKMF